MCSFVFFLLIPNASQHRHSQRWNHFFYSKHTPSCSTKALPYWPWNKASTTNLKRQYFAETSSPCISNTNSSWHFNFLWCASSILSSHGSCRSKNNKTLPSITSRTGLSLEITTFSEGVLSTFTLQFCCANSYVAFRFGLSRNAFLENDLWLKWLKI